MMTHVTQHRTRPALITAVWRRWLEQNRAYAESFERWGHPGKR
jgi:hypothetical protein